MYAVYCDGELIYAPNLVNEGYSAISAKLTLELNKAGSLEITIPPTSVVYNRFQKLKSIITVEQDGTEIFRGRVLHDEKDFYNRKQVYCEGELAFLLDSICRPYNFSGSVVQYFRQLISNHNAQVEEDRQFMVGSVTVTDPNDYIVRSNSDYENTLNELTAKCVNLLGGYIRTRKYGTWRCIDYTESAGEISSQVIEFGNNLLDVTEYISAENIFTVLIPLGARTETSDGTEGARLTVASVNSDKDYIENPTGINLFGKIWRTEKWDNVTVAANLLTRGRTYLNNNISMAVTLSIKAVDLHLLDVDTARIRLGDSIRVVSPVHELDSYFLCTKMVIDMIDPSNTEYTMGSGFSALTDRQVSAMKQSSNAYSIAEDASSSVSNINVDVQGNYVSKSEFTAYQAQVNTNFASVTNKLTSVYHVKGSVDSYDDLPGSGNVIGDVWNVLDTGANYVWTSEGWDKLSETISLDGLATEQELAALSARVTALEGGNE